MKKYIAVPVKMKEEDFDIALFTFDNYPYTGVEELFDELKITFDEEDYSEDLKNQIAADLKEAGIEFSFGENEIIEDQNWMEEWEKQLKPFRANDRIAFCPSMKTDEIDAEIKIIVDPKMSFGTGEHATTRLVAQLMDGEVEKDSFWVDAGCGTGALAVLAIKLGARECYAFDNDIWSVENSIENVAMNNVSDKIKVEQVDILKGEIPKADGIAANLFIHLIKDSMEKFFESLKDSKGVLMVSGVMTYDAPIAIAKAEEVGFTLEEHITEDEWSAFKFRVK